MVVGYQTSNNNLSLPYKFIMRSKAETEYRKLLNNKLTLLISLWIIDKLTMLIMFLIFKQEDANEENERSEEKENVRLD